MDPGFGTDNINIEPSNVMKKWRARMSGANVLLWEGTDGYLHDRRWARCAARDEACDAAHAARKEVMGPVFIRLPATVILTGILRMAGCWGRMMRRNIA